MAAKSQRKGRRGELELAEVLRAFGYDVRPAEAVNFGTIPDLIGLPGIHIECKRNEHLNLSEAMKQAEKDSQRFQDGCPAVFHRKNRERWLVTMMVSDFMKIYTSSTGGECS